MSSPPPKCCHPYLVVLSVYFLTLGYPWLMRSLPPCGFVSTWPTQLKAIFWEPLTGPGQRSSSWPVFSWSLLQIWLKAVVVVLFSSGGILKTYSGFESCPLRTIGLAAIRPRCVDGEQGFVQGQECWLSCSVQTLGVKGHRSQTVP